MELFVFWLGIAIVTGIAASSRGRTGFGWFLLGCLFSILALIAVLVLPSRNTPALVVGGEVASPDTHVRCPECKELVRADATLCRWCHTKLSPAIRSLELARADQLAASRQAGVRALAIIAGIGLLFFVVYLLARVTRGVLLV